VHKLAYNSAMHVEIQSPIDEETAAAIVAAVCLLLSQADPALAPPTRPRSAWASAGIRENQRAFEMGRPGDTETQSS
jgi:hypothetical protein